MIAPASTMPGAPRFVVRKACEDVHLLDVLQAEAAREVDLAFGSVSQKRITAATLPGFGRSAISRARNGCATNPLFRIAGWFILARRLGIPKHVLQRWIDWQQKALDHAYEGEEETGFEEAAKRDVDLDVRDDPERVRALDGDEGALRRYIDAKLAQMSYTPTLIAAARRRLAATG